MHNRLINPLIIYIILVVCISQSAAEMAIAFHAPIPNTVKIHQDIGHDGHDHVHINAAQATAEMQVVLVPSELIVGSNRFAVGLFDTARGMIHEAKVHFHYYDLSTPTVAVLESEADATRLQTPDGLTTIFVHERVFERTGAWGVEVQTRFSDGTAAIKRIRFEVLADSAALRPSEKAPRLDTPTAGAATNGWSHLTSARVPNPSFYELTLAEAMANGRPTVLIIATPGFCKTRFCGPTYEITSALQKRYGDKANFVHVEVYKGLPNPAANNWEVTPTMMAFGLTTEPWLFLIDTDGTIVHRIEGMFTIGEIQRHLQAMLEG